MITVVTDVTASTLYIRVTMTNREASAASDAQRVGRTPVAVAGGRAFCA